MALQLSLTDCWGVAPETRMSTTGVVGSWRLRRSEVSNLYPMPHEVRMMRGARMLHAFVRWLCFRRAVMKSLDMRVCLCLHVMLGRLPPDVVHNICVFAGRAIDPRVYFYRARRVVTKRTAPRRMTQMPIDWWIPVPVTWFAALAMPLQPLSSPEPDEADSDSDF